MQVDCALSIALVYTANLVVRLFSHFVLYVRVVLLDICRVLSPDPTVRVCFLPSVASGAFCRAGANTGVCTPSS